MATIWDKEDRSIPTGQRREEYGKQYHGGNQQKTDGGTFTGQTFILFNE